MTTRKCNAYVSYLDDDQAPVGQQTEYWTVEVPYLSHAESLLFVLEALPDAARFASVMFDHDTNTMKLLYTWTGDDDLEG